MEKEEKNGFLKVEVDVIECFIKFDFYIKEFICIYGNLWKLIVNLFGELKIVVDLFVFRIVGNVSIYFWCLYLCGIWFIMRGWCLGDCIRIVIIWLRGFVVVWMKRIVSNCYDDSRFNVY